ncbi:ATP-dependent zinc metalloprotease FtsH [archaeon]|nr:ATP-dependent zinc metalloprotease FtsH [archaeon]
MSKEVTEDVEGNVEYLLERLKDIEKQYIELKNENSRIKVGYTQRIKWLEERKKVLENEMINMDREIKRIKNELERMRTIPLIIGTIVEVIDDRRIVVKSSGGPVFIVSYSSYINPKDLVSGIRVTLNQQSLAVIDVLPVEKDPSVLAMEIDEKPGESYSEIGGLRDKLREVREVVELPLLKPELFEKVGIDPPRGVLLYGAPGSGKTLVARAIAHETNSVFIRMIGSELVRKYIGEGAKLVRELFKLAREKAPCIVFIDEIDSIGAKRSDALTSGEREVQRTLMQLLAEMDGFEPRGEVKIIAATNRPDILDTALLRPGRFDRLIEIPLPDKEGRREIFKIHTRRMNLDSDIESEYLAELTPDASGADIKAIATEAGMFAIRDLREKIILEDFSMAIDKVLGKAEIAQGGRKQSGVMYS